MCSTMVFMPMHSLLTPIVCGGIGASTIRGAGVGVLLGIIITGITVVGILIIITTIIIGIRDITIRITPV